jgi:hypothetical protein
MRLSHNRWYSRGGQRQIQGRAFEKSSAIRKVLGLALLLVLVIMLMQQLADPKKYGPAFTAIGLAQTAQPAKAVSSHGSTHKSESHVSKATVNVEVPPISESVDRARQAWLTLLKELDADSLAYLAASELQSLISEASSDKPAQGFATWLKETEERLSAWQVHLPNAEPATDSNDVRQFNHDFAKQWSAWAKLYRDNIRPASSALDPDIRHGLQLAIDQKLLGLIHDAEPWRPMERTTLARTLDLAQEARRQSSELSVKLNANQILRMGNLAEVPSLSKQTNDLRGTIVRLRGAPVTTPVSSRVNAPGWSSIAYDVVWLRPDGFSPQPICLYHLQDASPQSGWPKIRDDALPSSRREGAKTEGIAADESPMMEVTGYLLKRIAYPSQRGIDVAPILVSFDARWVSELDAKQGVFANNSVPRRTFSKWIEPGAQSQNLEILTEILASDLELLRDDNIVRCLIDANFGKISAAVPDKETEYGVTLVEQLLHQLPRIARPLKTAFATQAEIGAAQLRTLRGWVDEVRSFSLANTPDSDGKTIKRYRLRVTSELEGKKHYVFTNQVPRLWQTLPDLWQPIEIEGLNLNHTVDNTVQHLWLADHPRWAWAWLDRELKDELRPALSEDWRRLGRVGFDLGQAEMVHQLSKQSLTKAESESFYSLINANSILSIDSSILATERIVSPTSESAPPAPSPPLSIFDCLNNDARDTFRNIVARVHVVRVTPIVVADELDQIALDGDRYYELDGLADIRGQSVRLKSVDGKTRVDFTDDFPITLVTKRLPSWLLPSAAELGDGSDESIRSGRGDSNQPFDSVWYPRKTIELEGSFYRLWSYATTQTRNAIQSTSEGTVDKSRSFLQNGPLIVVSRWRIPADTPAPSSNRSTSREILLGLGFSAVVIYIIYRLQSSGGKKRRPKAA